MLKDDIKDLENYNDAKQKIVYLDKLPIFITTFIKKHFPYIPTLREVLEKMGDIGKLIGGKYIWTELLLKEIAIEIDNRYEGHISKNPEIYCVSVLNGEIKKINKNNIHTYKHFAAFRTKEDALEAIRILKLLYQDMF